MTQPIVRVDNMSKSYGTQDHSVEVLRDVNLSIMPGEKASLVGPSGSGKSTLLSLVAASSDRTKAGSRSTPLR